MRNRKKRPAYMDRMQKARSRVVLAMMDQSGLEVGEVAAAIGTSPSAVYRAIRGKGGTPKAIEYLEQHLPRFRQVWNDFPADGVGGVLATG
jgi:predicted transcriptional regulator